LGWSGSEAVLLEPALVEDVFAGVLVEEVLLALVSVELSLESRLCKVGLSESGAGVDEGVLDEVVVEDVGEEVVPGEFELPEVVSAVVSLEDFLWSVGRSGSVCCEPELDAEPEPELPLVPEPAEESSPE
jgi:hypothetical protein